MRLQATPLALWASLIPLCLGINIAPTGTGGLALARILFGDSRDVFSSSSGYSGDPSAIRSFTDGPFGMGSGIILSTGSLTSAPLTPDATCPSSYTTDLYDAYTTSYCGEDSYNGASYLLNVLPTKATTLLIDMVIASCDVISADKVLVLVDGVNVAKDETGTPLDSSSKYLSEPWGIPSPNGDTAFAWSSPPLRFSIPLPKTYVELKIAVCDRHDGYGDTAVMIKARPCTNCDQSFKVDYDTTSVVSTTTYEATSVVTQAASGTVRGTISYVTYVTASATSTTSSTSSDSTSSASEIPTSSDPSTSSDSTASETLPLSASLASSASATAILSTTFSTTTTSAITAPTPCNQLDNPSYIGGVELSLFCGKQATGGNQIDYSNQLHSLTECMTLCADTLACRAVTFNNFGDECTLYDGFNGFMSDYNLDMAVVASRPAISSTTESSTEFSTTTSVSSTSTTAPSGPISCSQMAGSIYTGPRENKFTISCDTSSTGESIYRRDEEDSMQGCLDRCDNDSRDFCISLIYLGVYSIDVVHSLIIVDIRHVLRNCIVIAIIRIRFRDYVRGHTGVAIIYSYISYISYNITSRYLITNNTFTIYIIIVIIRRSIRDYIKPRTGVYTGAYITFNCVSYNLTRSYFIINNIVTIYITCPLIMVIVRIYLRVYVGCHIGIHIS
ncbi:hypothetical protein Forpe1208_v008265 [Fusarium oxysporum f. sp. rapae]|uniref:Apple domain-containing protein n=1 Tax=Fusarium oxysporum f. sp. rapae TaxID=485398 RepID=A0A8J5NX69_FUSOX|nr:hypothetical protein Forpe1208_v008265 [Fusarium oxysporum f. sp. rapae]